jgi:hypothetical protein
MWAASQSSAAPFTARAPTRPAIISTTHPGEDAVERAGVDLGRGVDGDRGRGPAEASVAGGEAMDEDPRRVARPGDEARRIERGEVLPRDRGGLLRFLGIVGRPRSSS